MNFKGTVRIETDRLILRKFTENDAADMYKNWAGDRNVTRYLRFLPHESEEHSKRVLKELFIPFYCDEKYMTWAIELKGEGIVIGSISLTYAGDQSAEPGYCIGTKWQGQGYMTEALKAVLDFAFKEVGLNRVFSYHSVKNPASGAVMKKAGMKYEGFAREKYITGEGEYQDCRMYGITAAEYFNADKIDFERLEQAAKAIVGERNISPYISAGSVAAALVTDRGNVYTGVCIDAKCSIGFCAEHSAIAAMIAAGESKVKMLVAVNDRGVIYPPCGRCRELMCQLDPENADTLIKVTENEIKTLEELMPFKWFSAKKPDYLNLEIESQRLVLRSLSLDNIQDIFVNFTPEVTEYMFPKPAEDISETEEFVRKTLENMEKGKEIVFAVRTKEGEFIGLCGIHSIKSKKIELGIWTKKAAHGKGYGLEAIAACIRYIRDELLFDVIVYPVDRRNAPSRRIPILMGGKLFKTYELKNLSGKTLEIEEYHIS